MKTNILKLLFFIFNLFLIESCYTQVILKDRVEMAKVPETIEPLLIEQFINYDTKKIGRRRLIVENNTGRSIKVYLAYRTKYSNNKWGWNNKTFESYWELSNGARSYLNDGKDIYGNSWRINADYIFIWAKSSDGKWVWPKYKKNMLTIGYGPPEKGVIGEFTFTFE